MARRRVSLLAALWLGGCSAPAGTSSGPPTPKDPLIGVWQVTLTVAGAAKPREQQALVALVPTESSAAAYLGLYDMDLTALGVHPFVVGDPPRATGVVTSRTVRLVLNDTVDFGRVVLVGRAVGAERITGSWEVTERRQQGARGRFSMQPRWSRADRDGRDGLSGIWQLTLRVERPGSEGTARVGTGMRATVVLAPRGVRRAGELEMVHVREATHVGLHSADLEPIGIRRKRMRLPGRVLEWPPVAAARVIGGDQVEAALDPTGDRGAILMRGRMEGGRIEGRWEETGDAARGTFAMERVSVIESRHHQD